MPQSSKAKKTTSQSHAPKPRRAIRLKIILALAVLVYMAVYLLFGQRGIYRAHTLEHEILPLEARVEELTAQKDVLAERNKAMHPSHVDMDLAEELIRSEKKYVRKNDIVLMDR